MGPETKNCQNCKSDFIIEPDDFAFYEKIKVPAPTWCAKCRRLRRLMSRNERCLYRDTCDMCKKSMLSTYAPDSPYTVYCKECWLSDRWDPASFGVDYDFSRPFFEQFDDLKRKVPRLATMQVKHNTDAEYANFLSESKNVYLAYSIIRSENIMYSRVVDDSKDCMDCSDLQHGELCYEAIQSDAMNHTTHTLSCTNCLDAMFLFDCVNSQSCFMSSNVRSRQYVFRNEQLSKEDYKEKMKEIDFGSYARMQELKKEYREMMKTAIHKYADMLKSTNCTGENMANSKNVRRSSDVYDSEESSYCDRFMKSKDCYDVYGCIGALLCYESLAMTYGGNSARFVLIGDDIRDSDYTDYCISSSNLFGCIGLRKKSYCILNKQYDKESYEKLRTKIIEHMNSTPYVDAGGRAYKYGEFFPPNQYAYNESFAQEEMPLLKEQVLALGYRWRDPEVKNYQPTLLTKDIPDHINEIQDSIVGEIIGCEHIDSSTGGCNEQCTTAFKITAEELQFYRRIGIPLPRLCPNCRYYARLAIRNPHQLWKRQCACDYATHKNTAKHAHHSEGRCNNEFETPYAPERPEIVYCESCYQAEVM